MILNEEKVKKKRDRVRGKKQDKCNSKQICRQIVDRRIDEQIRNTRRESREKKHDRYNSKLIHRQIVYRRLDIQRAKRTDGKTDKWRAEVGNE